jgi:hypothetical protein
MGCARNLAAFIIAFVVAAGAVIVAVTLLGSLVAD